MFTQLGLYEYFSLQLSSSQHGLAQAPVILTSGYPNETGGCVRHVLTPGISRNGRSIGVVEYGYRGWHAPAELTL